MNGDNLIQNVFNLFIMAIILESAITSVFTLSSLKKLQAQKPVEVLRDTLILLLAFFLCYKVKILTIFRGTGIKIPEHLDTLISALVMTRMANFIRDFTSKIKLED